MTNPLNIIEYIELHVLVTKVIFISSKPFIQNPSPLRTPTTSASSCCLTCCSSWRIARASGSQLWLLDVAGFSPGNIQLPPAVMYGTSKTTRLHNPPKTSKSSQRVTKKFAIKYGINHSKFPFDRGMHLVPTLLITGTTFAATGQNMPKLAWKPLNRVNRIVVVYTIFRYHTTPKSQKYLLTCPIASPFTINLTSPLYPNISPLHYQLLYIIVPLIHHLTIEKRLV